MVDETEKCPPELDRTNTQESLNLDSGAGCLQQLFAYHDIRTSSAQIHHDFSNLKGRVGIIELVRAARRYGLKAKAISTKMSKLADLQLPAIAELENGDFVVVNAIQTDNQIALTHASGATAVVSSSDFTAIWSGQLILFARRAEDIFADIKFGMRWFLPVMAKYKRLFSEVFLASFFLQCFALITPLFFLVIIDKVLVHRGLTTLDVLIIALVGLIFFEVLLGFLRTYIFSHTTTRVDVQLGSQLFSHMLSLPISYFEKRSTGQTVARVRELDKVREFLTSSALTVVIDLFFTVIFFVVMWVFSPLLTKIVLASIPFYVVLSVLITPALRMRVEDRFQRGATNQAFLVESVSGVETLKAMAVEPQMRSRWDENLAAFVKSSFRASILGAAGTQTVLFINKITMALVLWYGAKLVMTGQLTVGQLVAFNMLAGQVAQPIIRIAQLWQDFQQFRISIQRLGDILNAEKEMESSSGYEMSKSIDGDITFEDVSFRYNSEAPEVLHRVSLKIKSGQIIGIVGRSGSGKSTVTKLIQCLHLPHKGRVFIDKTDISTIAPSWLRRQVGVVLQDNVLFNRSIRDNIAFVEPAMPLDKITEAAKLAGAHDFIQRLPRGYDTILEERGSNLSGGQRQRIAIARAIATDPKILILDEATAALDYESERLFQDNLKHVVKGRTVIIVAHRLSTVRDSNRILVMDQGKIVEDGSHKVLLKNDGIYASLIKQERGDD